MKKLILPLLMLTLPAISTAESVCVQMSEVSGSIMHARQNGIDIATMFSIVDKVDAENPTFFRELIILAYSSPHYRVEENKETAIREFKTEVFIECYKKFGGGE